MSEVTTTKELNLYQLGQEIGNQPPMRMIGPDAKGEKRLTVEGVGKDRLSAAVDAHEADPSIVPPPTAEEIAERERAARDAETRYVLSQAVPTLRRWAKQAEGHTVTPANAIATVQTITDNLAIFYARFADLLEHQYSTDA